MGKWKWKKVYWKLNYEYFYFGIIYSGFCFSRVLLFIESEQLKLIEKKN